VSNVAERVAYVEGQVSELSLRLTGVEAAIARLEQRMDRLEQRMDLRFDLMDRRFSWMIGIQITTLLAIFGALLSRP
jgi:uncharacterized coiled-coil protein SlyX